MYHNRLYDSSDSFLVLNQYGKRVILESKLFVSQYEVEIFLKRRNAVLEDKSLGENSAAYVRICMFVACVTLNIA